MQVRELHRLYNVQKMLMGEIKQSGLWNIQITNSDQMNHSHQYLINLQNSSTQITSVANNLNFPSLRDDLNSREHSGSCSGDNVKILRGFDLEMPATEFEHDISTGISVIDEEDQTGQNSQMSFKDNKKMMSTVEGGFVDDIDSTEVELSLSIGSSSLNNKRGKSKNKETKELDSSASFKAADRSGGDCSDPNTPMSSSIATIFDQKDRKQPLWLFHSLKLK